MEPTQPPFYVTGGSLPSDTHSYIERQADQQLHDSLLDGEFCYVLTSRQMGKSSLMVRTAARLREEGVTVAVLDLTSIGQNVTPEQWYFSLLLRLGELLRLDVQLERFWATHPQLGPLRRFMAALEQVVLAGEGIGSRVLGIGEAGPNTQHPIPSTQQRLVIFIDEIDIVRSLPFSTDEFFAAIRECYNRRTQDPAFERLTFCLLGVAAPSDLIRDVRLTPFNIGRRIELRDFTEQEAAPLAAGLLHHQDTETPRREREGRALLRRVLHWTGGHPYLTQRLCQAVAATDDRRQTTDRSRTDAGGGRWSVVGRPLCGPSPSFTVDRLCAELFFAHGVTETEGNLTFVRDRLLKSDQELAAALDLYARVQKGERVPDDDTNPLCSVLKLSGAVKFRNGTADERRWTPMGLNWIRNKVLGDSRRVAAVGGSSFNYPRPAAFIGGSIPSSAILTVRNRIYERVFDREWVVTHMPDAELRRQRTAFRRGLARAGALASAVVAVISLLAIAAAANAALAERNRKTADRQATDLRTLNGTLQRLNATLEQRNGELRQALAEAQAARGTAKREAQRANVASGRAHQAAARAIDAQGRADAERNRAVRQKVLALNSAQREARARQEEARQRLRAERGERAAHVRRYAAEVSLGLQALAEGHLAQAREMALRQVPRRGEEDLRGFEWRHLRLLCRDENWLTLRGYTGWNRGLLLSPSGRLLAAQAANNTIALWEISATTHSARAIGSLPGGGVMAFSPDGRFLFHPVPGAGVKMTNLATRKDEATFAGGGALALSADGRRLATETGERVHVYDVASRQEIATFSTAPTPVQGLAFSPNGGILAGRLSTSGAEVPPQTIRLWDMRSRTVKADLPIGERWFGQFALSPDGKRVALGLTDGRIAIFDVSGRDAPHELPALTADMGIVFAVQFSPDGRSLASASSDQTIRIWNLEERRAAAVLHGHEGEAWALAYSADGKALASASADGSIRLWDTMPRPEPGVAILPRGGIYVTFAPDGKTLATSGNGSVELWDPERERRQRRITDRQGEVESVAFSPDGRLLAGVVRRSDGSRVVRLWSMQTTEPVATLELGATIAYCIAFSPGGRLLAAGLGNGEIQLWDVRSHWRVGVLKGHTDSIRALTFSPDGGTLASGGRDGELRLWQVATQQEIRRLHGQRGRVYCLAFAPGGRTLVGGDGYGDLHLWHVANGAHFAVLRGHRAGVFDVAVAPDGRTAASGSDDGTLRLWHLPTMQQVAILRTGHGAVASLTFSPDGTTLASGHNDGEVRLWRAPMVPGSAAESRTGRTTAPSSRPLACGIAPRIGAPSRRWKGRGNGRRSSVSAPASCAKHPVMHSSGMNEVGPTPASTSMRKPSPTTRARSRSSPDTRKPGETAGRVMSRWVNWNAPGPTSPASRSFSRRTRPLATNWRWRSSLPAAARTTVTSAPICSPGSVAPTWTTLRITSPGIAS